jgi:hypothetical protein
MTGTPNFTCSIEIESLRYALYLLVNDDETARGRGATGIETAAAKGETCDNGKSYRLIDMHPQEQQTRRPKRSGQAQGPRQQRSGLRQGPKQQRQGEE